MMKKICFTLASMACGAAMANNVTLFGVMDVAVGNYAGASSAQKVVGSGLSAAMIGFRGVEDLGGGNSAGFWLEAGIEPDTGTGQATSSNNLASGATTADGLKFNRRSTVGVAGRWGEIRLGRDYSPDYWNKSVFDPFGALSVARGTNLTNFGTGLAAIRTSNSVSYLYGIAPHAHASGISSRGLHVQMMAGRGEIAQNSDGDYTGFRVGYKMDKLHVALAMGKTKVQAVEDYHVANIGASWQFDSAEVSLLLNRNHLGNGSNDNRTIEVGTKIPVKSGLIRASYLFQNNKGYAFDGQKAHQLAVGYVHLLSKRTSLYGTAAYLKNSGNSKLALYNSPAVAANGSSRGFEMGIRHAF